MSADNRTEKATSKRRGEARQKGQVVRSVDVNTAAVLAATIGALAALGPRMLRQLEALMAQGLAQSGDPSLASSSGVHELTMWGLRAFGSIAGPVLGAACATGLAVNVLQVRLRFSPVALQPSLAKLNPVPGLKRLGGKDGVVEAAKAVAKTAAVGFAAFLAVWPRLPELGGLVGLPPAELLGEVGSMVMSVAVRVLFAFAVVAAIDWFWQRRRFEQRLKMTKEEVKQEQRQAELSPEVRRSIRRRQMEQARRRMMAAVPTADAVVVNRTHFAVALRYDGKKPAPEVVAKGADLVAAAIRKLAEENGVPVISNPPLARALYREVELGHQIPEQFFVAVAEVLAFVFRTAKRRRRALAA